MQSFSSVTALLLAAFFTVPAPPKGQVTIRIPKAEMSESTPIDLVVENGSDLPITICQISCGMILSGGPIPAFHIEVRKGLRWEAFYWACDAGRWDQLVEVAPRERREAAVRLAAGRYRLRLRYKEGPASSFDPEKGCDQPGLWDKDSAETSATFRVITKKSK